MNQATTVTETDAIVIGAGPVGLYQVFQLGLLGLNTHVVDALPHVGGQCVELYGNKPIYDIPGIPMCTGQELIGRLQEQIKVLKTPFHLNQEVAVMASRADGRFDLKTSQQSLITQTIIIASGVGAFKARRLNLPGLELHEGRQVFYHRCDLNQFKGKQVFINGGETSALETAIECAQLGIAVTLVHRRDIFKADDALVQEFQTLCNQGSIQVLVGQISGFQADNDTLMTLEVTDFHGQTKSYFVDVLLPLLGISPKLGAIAEWGVALENKQVLVDTEKFQTNVPGIFAVGDINTYPGKKKLIVCGFHEATMAAYACLAHIHPDQPIHLQYTTTSPKLHAILGVSPKL